MIIGQACALPGSEPDGRDNFMFPLNPEKSLGYRPADKLIQIVRRFGIFSRDLPVFVTQVPEQRSFPCQWVRPLSLQRGPSAGPDVPDSIPGAHSSA